MTNLYRVKSDDETFEAVKWVTGCNLFEEERRDDGVYILLPRGWSRVSNGNWIVQFGKNNLLVITDYFFRKIFTYHGEVEE